MILSAARDEVARRLSDPTYVHWTPDELTGVLIDALRQWQAWTATWRTRSVFSAESPEAFYDLPTVIPATRGYSVTLRDMIQHICYDLQEPIWVSGSWTGSRQYSLQVIVDAIEAARNAYLLETGAVVTHARYPISPATEGRTTLPAEVMTLRRVAWHGTVSGVMPLLRDDSWGSTHYQPSWPQNPVRPPTCYTTSDTPVRVVQVAPPPADAGVLDLISVNQGSDLPVTVPTTLLGIPDDWAWVVRYGALAELLHRDGLAYDPARAAYCTMRWDHGVQLASTAPVVIGARINGVICPMATVAEADLYSPFWQLVTGPPHTVLTSAQNLVGLWPPPGALPAGGQYSISLDVIQNCPIPTLSEEIDLPAGVVDSVLDLAQHIAIFKEGPQQVEIAQQLLNKAAGAAGTVIARQQASQPARRGLLQQTANDAQALPQALPDPAEVA